MISKQNQVMAVLDEDPNLDQIMDEIPTNLTLDKSKNTSTSEKDAPVPASNANIENTTNDPGASSETKIQLSFSVDRLLSRSAPTASDADENVDKCCESVYACCTFPSCLVGSQHEIHQRHVYAAGAYSTASTHQDDTIAKIYQHSGTMSAPFADFKAVVRPTPIRAIGNNCDAVSLCAPVAFPGALSASSLIRFHQQQQQQQKSPHHGLSSLLAPLSGLKSSLQLRLQQHSATHYRPPSEVTSNHRFNMASSKAPDIVPSNHHHHQHQHHHHQLSMLAGNSGGITGNGNNSVANSGSSGGGVGGGNGGGGGGIGGNNSSNSIASNGKRKRSWSRAVFSNLQRKGLEIQFQQQKYITKPDRRKLAARLNLTDAQVKVWFQNRRMKWRHTRENLKSGQEKQITTPAGSGRSTEGGGEAAGADQGGKSRTPVAAALNATESSRELGMSLGYLSSDDASSMDQSDSETLTMVEIGDGDDDDEIDVVE